MRPGRFSAMRRGFAWFGGVLALACASSAQAAWIRAETDRFIVYGEGREASVRDYAVRLAAFDAVLRAFHPVVAKQEPGHRLEVVLVQGAGGVRQVAPGRHRSTRGFYAPTADGVFAVVDTSEAIVGKDDVLFHEYAHHFMYENFPAAYPAWFVEGWAEYFMTAEIGPKEVKVGTYNPNRVYWLFNSSWLPMGDLLTKAIWEVPKDKQAIYYPQAWLLMHYMRSDTARGRQMDQATRAIAKGENPVKAYEAATGLTMAQLTAKLKKYNKLPTYGVPNPAPPTVAMTVLPRSADDFLLARVRLATTSVGARDDAFVSELRRRTARHPGDKLADLTLAHAEFLMGDVAAGEAIVQRRLAADPNEVDALRLAGRGQVLAGERAPNERAARFAAARPLFAKAYKLDQKDYRILYQYAYARTTEASFPTKNDVEVLTQAYFMAPSVHEIAMVGGIALMQTGQKDAGAALLSRIANNPHGGPMAAKARALIAGKTMAEADAAAGAAPEEDKPPEPAEPAK